MLGLFFLELDTKKGIFSPKRTRTPVLAENIILLHIGSLERQLVA